MQFFVRAFAKHSLRSFLFVALLSTAILAGVTPVYAQGKERDSIASADTLELSLEAAVSLALEHNLSLQAALTGRKQAKYQELERWGAIMPTVTSTADYNRYVKKPVIFLPEGSPMGNVLEIGSDNSYNATISATLPLLAMPLYRGIQASKVEREIADETVRNTRVGLAGDVKLAYIGYLLSQESLRVMDSTMNTAQRTLKNVERLTQQGMTAEYDLVRARVQVSNLQPMHVQAKQGVEVAASNLRMLMGVEGDQPLKLTGSLDALVASCSADTLLGADPLVSNSDLRLLELQQKKLHRQFQMARESLWPTLGAFANYQWMTQSNTFDFDKYQWINTFVVGLRLNIPIFGGLQKQWQVQQLKIGKSRLEMQVNYAREQMSTQALVIRQQMIAAQESMISSREGQLMAERGVMIARTRYETGSGTLLELNDAEMALTQASLNYNQAQYNFVKAYVEFLKLRGEEK